MNDIIEFVKECCDNIGLHSYSYKLETICILEYQCGYIKYESDHLLCHNVEAARCVKIFYSDPEFKSKITLWFRDLIDYQTCHIDKNVHNI